MSKKLIIAFSALALAILAGAIAVVGVFAAQQQKVANTFTITYTANNVKAMVFASYSMADGSNGSLTGETMDYVSFTPELAEQTKTFTSEDIELTAQNNWIWLTFVIQNTASTGGKSVTATLTDGSSSTNVNVYHWAYAGTNAPTTFTQFKEVVAISTLSPITIAAGSMGLIQVGIEIKDDTLPAEYISADGAGLHIALSSVS